jgi:hypothetical protein
MLFRLANIVSVLLLIVHRLLRLVALHSREIPAMNAFHRLGHRRILHTIFGQITLLRYKTNDLDLPMYNVHG